MLRPSPNHGTQRLPNDDDDDRRLGNCCKYWSHTSLSRPTVSLNVLEYVSVYKIGIQGSMQMGVVDRDIEVDG